MASTIYDRIGPDYQVHRRPDPRIQTLIGRALGPVRSVLNVGAGVGSYEPTTVPIVAVEPSAVMIRQRPPGAAPCVQARAEALPFATASFEGVLAVLTLHHWSQLQQGLAEMQRVVRSRIVIVTWDPKFVGDFWLTRDYLPEILDLDRPRFPTLATLTKHLGPLQVGIIPIACDCVDGFTGAFWQRPQAYLDPAIQKSISAFAQLDQDIVGRAMSKLTQDLKSGDWEKRNGDVKTKQAADLGYRIVTAYKRN